MSPEQRAKWREYAVREIYSLEDDKGNPRDPTPQEDRYIDAYTEYMGGSYAQSLDERDLIKRIVDTEEHVAKLVSALRSIEWIRDSQETDWKFCPSCEGIEEYGHEPHCAIAAVLNDPRIAAVLKEESVTEKPSVQYLISNWGSVIESALLDGDMKLNSILYHVLPFAWQDDTLVLQSSGEFFVRFLNKDENIVKMEMYIGRLVGFPVRVRSILVEEINDQASEGSD